MNEFNVDEVLVGYTDEQLDAIEEAWIESDVYDLVKEIRRLNNVQFEALRLLHAAHRERDPTARRELDRVVEVIE